MKNLKTHTKGQLYTNGRIIIMCTESNTPSLNGGDPTILSGVCIKGNTEYLNQNPDCNDRLVVTGDYSTQWVRSFFNPLPTELYNTLSFQNPNT